jgi:hypothetical protein
VIETDTILSAAMSPWYGVENIIVKPGARLIVEGGTEIRMSDQVSLRIEGGLAFWGTPDQPVRMISNPEPWARLPEIQPTGRWGVIAIENATDSILLEYSEISAAVSVKTEVVFMPLFLPTIPMSACNMFQSKMV